MRNSSARAAVFNEAAHSQTFNKRRQATSSPAVAHAATPAATQDQSEPIYRPGDCRPDDLHDIWHRMRQTSNTYLPSACAVQTAPTPPTDPDGGVIDHGDGSFTVVRNNLIV